MKWGRGMKGVGISVRDGVLDLRHGPCEKGDETSGQYRQMHMAPPIERNGF